jgi:hypothetical protein
VRFCLALYNARSILILRGLFLGIGAPFASLLIDDTGCEGEGGCLLFLREVGVVEVEAEEEAEEEEVEAAVGSLDDDDVSGLFLLVVFPLVKLEGVNGKLPELALVLNVDCCCC